MGLSCSRELCHLHCYTFTLTVGQERSAGSAATNIGGRCSQPWDPLDYEALPSAPLECPPTLKPAATAATHTARGSRAPPEFLPVDAETVATDAPSSPLAPKEPNGQLQNLSPLAATRIHPCKVAYKGGGRAC